MNAETSEGGVEVPKADVDLSASKSKGTRSLSEMSSGSLSSKDMIFRADKIDLKSLDLQLEKHLSRVWSRNTESLVDNSHKPKEVWEIDPSKLEIRYFVAQGTYGTVFRGTYDNQDVAGETIFYCGRIYLFFTFFVGLHEEMD